MRVGLLFVLLLPARARAGWALGVGASVWTPTDSTRRLLDERIHAGVRFVGPAWFPGAGVLNVPGLALELGVEATAPNWVQVVRDPRDRQLTLLTALYRYSVPVDDDFLLYAGLGGRTSLLSAPDDTRDPLDRMRGSVTGSAGFTWGLGAGFWVDARYGGGLWGYSSREVSASVLWGG